MDDSDYKQSGEMSSQEYLERKAMDDNFVKQLLELGAINRNECRDIHNWLPIPKPSTPPMMIDVVAEARDGYTTHRNLNPHAAWQYLRVLTRMNPHKVNTATWDIQTALSDLLLVAQYKGFHDLAAEILNRIVDMNVGRI